MNGKQQKPLILKYPQNGGKDGYFWTYCPIRNKYPKYKHSNDEQIGTFYHRYNTLSTSAQEDISHHQK